MQRATTFAPFVDFLAEHFGETDEETTDLLDGIADTLGDMFGHSSTRYDDIEHFVGRLRAAADAAAQHLVMSRN